MYLPLAIEIANDRTREAERRALAREARAATANAAMSTPRGPRGPRRARLLLALPVRAFGGASHALSEAACSAATRIEGASR